MEFKDLIMFLPSYALLFISSFLLPFLLNRTPVAQLMNNILERLWIEAVVFYFNALSLHLLGSTE
jgi:hypothetical protein